MNQLNPADPQDGFEPWHLTAFALGELDSEMRERVQRRIASDPAMAQQLLEIQQTLDRVQSELAHSTSSIVLDESYRDGILDHMRQASQPAEVAHGPAVAPAVVPAVAPKDRTPWGRSRTMVGIAMLAAAASILLMLRFTGNGVLPTSRDSKVSYLPDLNEFHESESVEAAAESKLAELDTLKKSIDSPADVRQHSLEIRDPEPGKPEQADPKRFSMPAARSVVEAPQTAIPLASAVPSAPGGLPSAPAAESALGPAVDGRGGLPAGYADDFALVPSEAGLGRGMGGGAAGMSLGDGEARLGVSEPSGLSRESGERARQTDPLPEVLRANVPSWNRPREASGDRFQALPETPFVETSQHPLSTFSIDVDTASYAKLRQYLLEQNTLPTPETIRIEEWINYFDYTYPGPQGSEPFAAHLKLAICPWNTEHQLVRVAIQAKKVDLENRPASNLVFLIDVSGSMAAANKLPLVKRSLALLASQLGENDRVAIVVYAGAAGCVLPSTLGSSKSVIMDAINELQSGGSTNGGQGIELAYRIANENFIPGGINRVILCTDGDFNVGVTGTEQLVAMMKENARSNIFLTCLGYGIGNYNDAMMEQISNQGNGTYGMIDNELEARRMMVEQLSGTLMTVAKDVKIQVEFNPQKVGSYRLIGYENRRLATQDFADDRKDAGEIGAGHRVTALYEIVPLGKVSPALPEADLRYGRRSEPAAAKEDAVEDPELAREWMLLKIRAKKPDADESTLQEFVLTERADEGYAGEQLDLDWATSVAEFGLLLRRSALAPGADWERMLARAQENAGSDPYRRECILMMQQARRLSGR
jgi:Ca-activated chloride channel homolog